MTILNSMDESRSNEIKICNIVLNSATATILSLIGNFHLTEQAVNFKAISNKMTKLCHQIEDKLTIDLDSCTIDHIRAIINEYDALTEQIDYPYPTFIKNKVKKAYQNKMTLPNVLNCETRASLFQVNTTALHSTIAFTDIRTPQLIEAHSDRRETSMEAPESVALDILTTNEEADDLAPKPVVVETCKSSLQPKVLQSKVVNRVEQQSDPEKKKKKPIDAV